MSFWQKKAKEPINRNYVSELDQFLMEFDKRPDASSVSRKTEEALYREIYLLRDNEIEKEIETKLWENF